MNKSRYLSAPRALSFYLGAAFLLSASSAAWAATDVQVWHSLPDYNKKVFEKLVSDYNRSQKEVTVKLRAFGDEAQLDQALTAAQAKDRPNLFQLGETSGLDDVAQRSYVLPLYTLTAKSPIKTGTWFLPAANNFMHDAKGRMLALPLMAEIPVMFYNLDAFKKAGIVPTEPSRAWHDLQAQLVTLANNGSRRCPLTSDQPVSINLENLAAVNKQFYAGSSKAKAGFDFDALYIRHLSTMISWVRSEIMVGPEFGPQSVTRFAAGECAVLLSNSGNIGQLSNDSKVNYSLAGLPYYPEVAAQPGSPFVSGSGLWATKGHSAEQDKATTQFMAWLASAPASASWYQSTGYLPLTKEAFEVTDAKYYKDLGNWRDLVAIYEKNPENTTKGFKVHNYHQIRAMFNQTLQNALEGKQPAVTALRLAASEANKLANTK
ncbi:extracellular solute-binding protein [Paenalcaligenes niemegkensis]|uniref:extracellular solute-binding protein n=1 Tax=Paenalcaligenes niemegkensis TaxID=2895469 RepID=UPI001EE96B7D|nr:extracellular solute-binding protein [Paenalcaligenes niemegkensis]MCQ9616752.1 extracellular solute-binding protein [Paenalcaligenes niemegkensis]